MKKYTRTAMFFHWIIALLLIANFLLGITMADMPGISPEKLRYFSWHKWAGITIFGLVCLRLLWRLTHTPPEYSFSMPVWEKKAAEWMHGLLYILIFGIPLSGYLYSLSAGVPVVYLGIIPMPVLMGPDPELKPLLKALHANLNWVLVGAFFLHVLAALKHQFINRDDVMKRMWP